MWEALGFYCSYPYKADSIYTNEGETQALGAVIDMLKKPEMGARDCTYIVASQLTFIPVQCSSSMTGPFNNTKRARLNPNLRGSVGTSEKQSYYPSSIKPQNP